MGIAKDFSKTLHRELGAHAAWLPVSNSIDVGDYGLVSDGVFQRMGNIHDDFGVEIQSETAPAASLNFTSEGTKVFRLVGEAEVDALPDSPIEAKLKIEFGEKESYLLKAAKVEQVSMPDVGRVARDLANTEGWKRRYRVVHATLVARDSAVIITRSGNASLELSGKADALKQFELGTVNAGVTASNEENVGFTSLGKTGTVGLNLFKLKWWGSDTPKFLGPDEEAEIEMDDDDVLEDDV